MSSIYFLGKAPAVAQVGTVQITGYDGSTTYTMTINGNTVSTIAAGGVNQTATALAAAWNASTDPYFAAVTALASTDTITFTADTAGVPFTTTSSKSGAGTIGAYTAVTASAGPNDWSTAANWSGGAVPVNGDTVYIDTTINISWGLAQSAVTLAALIVYKNTGRIGLDRSVFATSSDNASTDSTRTEYRATYLNIKFTTCNIGQLSGTVDNNGSARILINSDSTAATFSIYGNNPTPSEAGKPGIRLLTNSASTAIYVYSAPGGVGLAIDAPAETSTASLMNVSDTSIGTKVFIGSGVTLTTWFQNGGINTLRAAATVTTVTVNGGVLTTDGDFIITTLNSYGGTTTCSHINSGSGGAVGTMNINGGVVDGQKGNRVRTWSTVNLTRGTLKSSGSNVTITSLIDPSIGNFQLEAAS